MARGWTLDRLPLSKGNVEGGWDGGYCRCVEENADGREHGYFTNIPGLLFLGRLGNVDVSFYVLMASHNHVGNIM